MAKFELKFLDFFGFHFIKVEKKTKELYTKNKDVIEITISDYNNTELFINLDKSTAIKFAKTLRTEINKITESEVNNG
jgi:hypothetical protein